MSEMSVREAHRIMSEASGIKEGDSVKILRMFKKGELDEEVGTNDNMPKCVGLTGNVTSILDHWDHVKYYSVKTSAGTHYWPFFVLQRVEEVKKAVKLPLELCDISRDVIVAVRDKWQNTLDTEEVDWSTCAMCRFVEKYCDENDIDTEDHCKNVCPLSKDGWCTGKKQSSRITKEYHSYDSCKWRCDVKKFVRLLNDAIDKADKKTTPVTFKVGDKVKMVKKTRICTDNSIGKVLEVRDVDSTDVYLSDSMYHRFEGVEKVSDDVIKVGDTVEVLRRSYNGFTEDIGKKMKVNQIDTREPRIHAGFWYNTEDVRKVC